MSLDQKGFSWSGHMASHQDPAEQICSKISFVVFKAQILWQHNQMMNLLNIYFEIVSKNHKCCPFLSLLSKNIWMNKNIFRNMFNSNTQMRATKKTANSLAISLGPKKRPFEKLSIYTNRSIITFRNIYEMLLYPHGQQNIAPLSLFLPPPWQCFLPKLPPPPSWILMPGNTRLEYFNPLHPQNPKKITQKIPKIKT